MRKPSEITRRSRGVLAKATMLALLLGSLSLVPTPSAALEESAKPAAKGPLRVHPGNPRYFTDDSGRAILLTGSHTWNNLVDMGPDDPPKPFDYPAYLQWLDKYPHNFFRLWAWELVKWDTRANREKKPQVHYAAPHPWPRTGPGLAMDGKPKFDLAKFDSVYFDRLRERVKAAQERGIYVSVMLFEGWGLQFVTSALTCHPFHPLNNISGVSGSGVEIHELSDPKITKVQEDYVRKVVDTVNAFDSVLYEISNENHPASTEWQYHMIRLIKDYEAAKTKRHPVGMTFQYKGGNNRTLIDSPADWISPNPDGGYKDDPPAADGVKVIVSDTDHLWGIGGSPAWVWKSFMRGLNPIYMDPYDGGILGKRADPEVVRKSMGRVLDWSRRVDLVTMTPQSDLASTKYCLAHPGHAYLVYLPGTKEVTVKFGGVKKAFAVEWYDPGSGEGLKGEPVQGGGDVSFRSPFQSEDAVLYITLAEAQGMDAAKLGEAVDSTVKVPDAMPPYPRSRVIERVELDWGTHRREATGSDNWPMTWADDGHQYAAWGDGGGFGGDNKMGRVTLGVARIEGGAEKYKGQNVWGGFQTENPAPFGGKSYGILSVGGTLYLWVVPQPGPHLKECRLAASSDHGATWTLADWAFRFEDGLTIPTFLNFGRDYAEARDEYVYSYFIEPKWGPAKPMDRAYGFDVHKPGNIHLSRVPKSCLLKRDSHEFFAGLDASGKPNWSPRAADKHPVFSDPNGVGWNVSVSYNAGLKRYMLATEHGETHAGRFGLFDAKEPWGPWTTVAYDQAWGLGHVETSAFFWSFPNKWLGADGSHFTMVFTGKNSNDSWNTVSGRFVTRRP